MSAAGFSAMAARIGAALGVLNLVIILLAKRPRFLLLPDEEGIPGSFDPNAVLIRIVAGDTPVLIRSVRFIPAVSEKDGLWDLDAKSRSDAALITRWVLGRRFTKLVGAGETGTIRLSGLQHGPSQRLIIIRWWDQRVRLFPWKMLLVTSQRRRDLAMAAKPTEPAA